MICSMCHKNKASIFSSKLDANGKREMDGLCINCAKKQGINTDEILRAQSEAAFNENMGNMNQQIEGLLKNLSENLVDMEPMDFNAIPLTNTDEDINYEDEPKIFAGAIPIGSIFGNIFNPQARIF